VSAVLRLACVLTRQHIKRQLALVSLMQNPDLSLFRSASTSKKHNLTHAGGDVFQVCSTPSDMSVLWGENFGAKERKFLRDMLSQETITFSLKDTYQIHIRTLFQAGANATMNIRHGFRRKGLCALLLHDLRGELTTSWTFAKFIRPLFRVGFSVLACDFPGFGKSSVAQVPSCPSSVWQGAEAHVVSKIMEEMSVARCQILAVGHTCGILLHMLQSSPHRMAGEHVLVNPVFDRNQLFHHVGIEPPPGAPAGWQDEIKARQQTALIDLLRTTRVRMWCLFDIESKYEDLNKTDGQQGKQSKQSKQQQQEWQNAYDTYEMLLEASKNEFVAENLKVSEITKLDLCEAQCGKRIPVRMLVPSRHLKASVARFMSSYEKKRWEDMFMPNHVAHQKGLTRASKYEKDEREKADADDSDASEHEAPGIGLPIQRALALMPQNAAQPLLAKDKSFKSLGESLDDATRQGQERALQALQLHTSKVRGMGASSSTGALPRFDDTRTSKHSVSAAASIAAGRLSKSGANAGDRGLTVTAEAARDKKALNWSMVPQEPDLSYGVRKMFLDSFEASVETYRQETEKEFMRNEQAERRRGLRIMESHSNSNALNWLR